MVLLGDHSAGKQPGSWRRIIDEHLALALGNSFRQQLLWILNERIASPSQLAKELGVTLNKVCHHMDALKRAECIELVDERTVGNRVQHFYRATSRAFLDGTDWQYVPDSVKVGLRATLLENVINDSIASVANEIYDANEGSHMSWTPGLLDDRGRDEVSELLEEVLKKVVAIFDAAKERLLSVDEIGMSYSVAMLGFPSIGGMRKVGPPIDAEELAAAAAKSVKRS